MEVQMVDGKEVGMMMKEIALKHVKPMAAEMLVYAIDDVLKEVVESTKTPFDDIAYANFKDKLKEMLLASIEKMG